MAIVFVIVAVQWAIVLLLTLIIVGIADIQAAFSFALGGLSYAVPTLLSVCFLSILKRYSPLSSGLMVVESLKIILTIALMVLVFMFCPALRFIPFFLGLLIASQFVFLLFLKVYRYVK